MCVSCSDSQYGYSETKSLGKLGVYGLQGTHTVTGTHTHTHTCLLLVCVCELFSITLWAVCKCKFFLYLPNWAQPGIPVSPVLETQTHTHTTTRFVRRKTRPSFASLTFFSFLVRRLTHRLHRRFATSQDSECVMLTLMFAVWQIY